MNAQLTINHYKSLWVIGAVERLATLGMLSPDIPMRLTPDAVDTFVELDKHRDKLFSDDNEIGDIFRGITRCENVEEVSDTENDEIVKLILVYKNDRTLLVKYALSHQTM